MMKKIDRYILKKFIKAVFLALFAFIAIFILSRLFKVIGYVTSNRLTPLEGVIYLVALLPKTIVKVMPLAALLGGLMTINKMASTLEVTALKTSGISFKRVILIPIIGTLFLSGGVFYLNNTLQAKGTKLARILKRKNQIKDDEMEKDKSNVYLRGTGNYIYHFDYINREENIGKGVMVVKLDKDFKDLKEIIVAKEGEYDRTNLVWKLKDVRITEMEGKKEVEQPLYIDPELKENPELFLTPKYRKEELTLGELKDLIVVLKGTGREYKEFLVEFHNRIAMPFACLFLGLIGLSLGSRYVRGSSAINIGLSIVFGYGYYIVQASFEAMSTGGTISPVLGAWGPNLIFLLIGIKVVNDSEY